MIRVRFALPAAGGLVVSGLRVALANHLFARRGDGRMLLRVDDLDKDRLRPGSVGGGQTEQIMQDLTWFGIGWDVSFRQSERLERYQDTIERLQRDQFIYPCFESEEELKAKAEFRRKRNQPVIYDRAMLSLTAKQRGDAEAGGKRPHWRFRLSGRTLEWNDLVLGPRRATLSSVSDPILVRADGAPMPVLASIVDDIDFGTTHLIRGEDNAGNTAIQIELFEVLRGHRPAVRFGHLPALRDTGAARPGGRKVGNLALRALRTDGVDPRAVVACLLGLPPEASPGLMVAQLAENFELKDLARSDFDVSPMLAANRCILTGLDFAAVHERLPVGATEAFWMAVRGHLDLLKEARGWWEVITGTIVPPVIENARDLLLTAEALLPREPWDDTMWATWITSLQQTTGRVGEALIAPLRLALTGEDDGPDLAGLLPLMGRSRAAGRLLTAAA